MPEMLMRYKPGPGQRDMALAMLEVATPRARELFKKEVVWEAREFDDTQGQPDFLINLWVTDNDDEYVSLAPLVQGAILDAMASRAWEDQRVECWVQLVKGKWGGTQGHMQLTKT